MLNLELVFFDIHHNLPLAMMCSEKTTKKNIFFSLLVPLTNNVYEFNKTDTENITGLNDAGCRALFGNAAQASQPAGHCECLRTDLAFWENNKCCT